MNPYGDGFCAGLQKAYEEQERFHEEEWGLALTIPKSVIDVMETMGKPFGYGEADHNDHDIKFVQEGYQDGKQFDPSTKLEGTKQGIYGNCQLCG